MSEKNLEKIKFKDKLGYALGDAGGLLTFSLIGAFQNVFYTDTLGIDTKKIAVLVLVARIWDAINDPLWGAFIDSRKPTKHGRFRPYIFWFSIPLAICAALMFTKIPGVNYLIYAYITYIMYGMMYTAVNIPYGSLASVITDDEMERSSLSMWRSIGAGVGGLPGTIILPLLVYSKNQAGDDELNSTMLTICVAVLALVSVLVYFCHFKMTKERIAPPEKVKGEYNAFVTIKDLLRNRPFVTLSLASMLLIAFQFYYQSTYPYLFSYYFGNGRLYSMVTICTYLPMAIFIPIMNKLIDKIGKKELCAIGMTFSTVATLAIYFLKTSNPYVFLAFAFLSGLGQTFLVLEVWALVMDVIDYHELKTGRREEGTAYAFFSFSRKLGQTLAGFGLNILLAFIGYNSEAVSQGIKPSAETIDKLYTISTLVPAIALGLMAVLLMFGYNLSKKELASMRDELDKKRDA